MVQMIVDWKVAQRCMSSPGASQPFLVIVSVPGIGQHKWTAWDHGAIKAVVLGCTTAEEATRKIKPHLPPEDPEVKRELWIQDKRSEYFDIQVVPLQGTGDVFAIPGDAWR